MTTLIKNIIQIQSLKEEFSGALNITKVAADLNLVQRAGTFKYDKYNNYTIFI